jgi:hypothetical protein
MTHWGDDPPQRSIVLAWQLWIDPAELPYSVFRRTRGPLLLPSVSSLASWGQRG